MARNPVFTTLALVGNPNCGKTSLFNALTGARQEVGNWPGVTVERKTGEYRFKDRRFQVVDLPGTYSLDVVDREISVDEQIARDYVQGGEADLVVNIVDAANLERNLYLSLQLAEMGAPLVVVLNMMDVAESRGLQVDPAALAERLGCPVLPVVASTGAGVAALCEAIHDGALQPARPSVRVAYESALERAVAALEPRLAGVTTTPRWLALRLLEGDDLARREAGEALATEATSLAAELEDVDILVADARYGLAHDIASATVTDSGRVGRHLGERIDAVVLSRTLGIPLFLLMMYLMFMLTINLGGAFIDVFDQLAGVFLVDGFGALLGSLGVSDWWRLLLADGIGGGLQVVATFIPIVGMLFLCLSILEDSGYMARAAFVMDRLMRAVGLPGKSFVPLIVGFGCNVPAIMGSRTLEHRRDRLMTIAMAPFMSCGARLPVFVLFAAAFFPHGGQNVVFGLYLIGIAVAVVTGLVLRHSLLRGETTPFIMELPPYHLPTLRGILLRTWDRLRGFVLGAGRVIVPMVLVLNVLNAVGTDGSLDAGDSDRSVLAAVGRGIAPAFAPMGLDRENWPAAVGIFTGVLAKEAVVGTLDAAYSALAEEDAGVVGGAASFDLLAGVQAALATVPANLADTLGGWADPLGLGAVNEPVAVADGTFGAMASRFDGAAGAFAYLLFILLYFPCTAALAAIYQEAGMRWALFVAGWTTGMGYGLATLFYQSARWSTQPLTASAWILAVLVAFGLALYGLWWTARREAQQLGLPAMQRA